MRLERATTETIELKNGDRLVRLDGDEIKGAIVLDIKPNFLYYEQRLLKQLSSGTISQLEYATRIETIVDGRTITDIEDLAISNDELEDLLNSYNINGLIGETALQTIQNINAEGIQIIK